MTLRSRLLEWLMNGFQMPTRVIGSRYDWEGREWPQREPDPSRLGRFGRLRFWLISVLAR